MLKFMLFGPAGIGKSTTICTLRQIGIDAVDLEDVSSDRMEYFKQSDHLVYGAADLNPADFFYDPDVITVLLTLPTERAYQQRRAHRDLRQPDKRSQPPQTRWDPTGFDAVFYARDGLITMILDLIVLWTHDPVLLAERGQTSR